MRRTRAGIGFAGTLLGVFVDRRFLAVPIVVTAFLLQHALQGWCPPVPLFRKAGVRTMRKIDTERNASKALRGDYGPVSPGSHNRGTRAIHALEAARL